MDASVQAFSSLKRQGVDVLANKLDSWFVAAADMPAPDQ